MIVSLTNLRYWLITNSVITWMMDLTITGLILPEERENKWWWCTRLSEISLFVRPVIRLLDDWSARLWQITLFCENGVQNMFYHSITKFVSIFKSLSSIYEKRNAILYTHCPHQKLSFANKKQIIDKDRRCLQFSREKLSLKPRLYSE